MAEFLDVLARRMEASGRGIDDDDDDRELSLFQFIGYERGRGGFGDVLIHQKDHGMLDTTTAAAMVGVDACHAMAPVSSRNRRRGKGRGGLGHVQCGHIWPKDTVGF